MLRDKREVLFVQECMHSTLYSVESYSINYLKNCSIHWKKGNDFPSRAVMSLTKFFLQCILATFKNVSYKWTRKVPGFYYAWWWGGGEPN